MTSYYEGLKFEATAKNYLEKLGYTILFQRYKTPYGEVDLIARDGNTVIAVEVKGRKRMSDAIYAIQEKQKIRITQAFQQFTADNPKIMEECPFQRFDVVLISSQNEIKYIPNAWQDDF